jgi:hypothetical protein
MTIYDKNLAKSHDDILERMAEALDIPPSKFEEASNRYHAIGNWLDRPESEIAQFKPAISPQGSFLLGTVTRPFTDAEEYDVDLVCRLEATKADFTQKTLKEAVGREVALYAEAHGMADPDEGRRCWTLNYAAGAQFHMDILPALPDAHLTGRAIAITDNTLPNYEIASANWPLGNPSGYAVWFRNRMKVRLDEAKLAFAKRAHISASVDQIPDHKVKTPLQRAIQLLKRHRDCMFAGDCEFRPISIIITTLAAHAYNEETTIAGALQSILTNMDRYIEDHDGVAWVANPVNPSENFADKWVGEPKKRANFYTWLDQARRDFGLYLRASKYDEMPTELRKNLGEDFVDRMMKAAVPASALGMPAIAATAASADDMRRAEHAIHQIKQSGSQSKPWAKA